MTGPADLFTSFRELSDDINRARLDVLAGRPVELGDFLTRVDTLCSSARDLPRPAQHALAPIAERALKACDLLQEDLRAALAPRRLAPEILP